MRAKVGKTQTGFSLVELMVAMGLGLVLSAGAVQLLITNRQTAFYQEALSEVQDVGRFAANFIVNDLRKAGYTESIDTPIDPLDSGNTTNGAAGANDQVEINYVAGPGGDIGCEGGVIAEGNDVTNHYFVSDFALVCDENGNGTGVNLASDIESFQLLYGVDDDADGIPNTYEADPPVDLQTVVAVRVGILIRGTRNVSAGQQGTVGVLDSTYVVPATPAGVVRRLFIRTALIRNSSLVLNLCGVGNPCGGG